MVEGAGAVPLAGLVQERELMRGRKVGVVLTGANIYRPLLARLLAK
jgi:threonine dehydratase